MCNCGSGLEREEVCDSRGICVACVCDKCREERLSHYRPDIFTNSNYWTDEPIEPGDY